MAVVHPRVFLGLLGHENEIEYIQFELLSERAPKACEMFYNLCMASQRDRSLCITHDGLIIESTSALQDTSDQESAIDASSGHDTLDWKLFSGEGLLYMSEQADGNEGVNQYIVTTFPRPDLNGKHVIIGTMTAGQVTLHYLVQSLAQERDVTELPVTAVAGGEVAEPRSGGFFDISTESFLAEPETDNACDRGRVKRRRPFSTSPSHIASRSTAPPSSKASKKNSTHPSTSPPPRPNQVSRPETSRRTSEHANDETRRGRHGFSPRAATPIEEDEEMRAARHQKRRSSPPSRGPKRDAVQDNEREEEGYRRRGSLPNHRDKIYHDKASNTYEQSSERERRRSKGPGRPDLRQTHT